jgi:hypothetical protein
MGLKLRSVVILAVLTWAFKQQHAHVHGLLAIAATNLQRRHSFFRGSLGTKGSTGLNRQQQRKSHGNQNISQPLSVSLLMSRWRGTEDVQGADVLKSCIPYLLPLLDGELFGKYIYQQVPPLGFLDSLFIGPLSEFYNRVPFLGLIMFLALTLGTRMNTDMNWNVRFNAQQAALIDVTLVFPELIGSAFEGEDLPRYIEAPCMNFVWYTYMAMVLYSIWSNVILRKRPDQIPWISAYATTLTGPI